MVLAAAAVELPRNGGRQGCRARGRQVTDFRIVDCLVEVVDTRRQVGLAERASIAQLVGDLFLCEFGTGVEQGERRRVDIARRVRRELAVAEDVGDLAVAEIDIIIGAQRAEDGFRFAEARIVDREVEAVAIEV